MGKYDFVEESSGSEDDDDILQDEIEALSKACMPSSTSDGRENFSGAGTTNGDFLEEEDDDLDDDDDDDLELVRSIKEQYGCGADITQPMSLRPLTSLPPITSDDDEDDFETLRAIQKRFSHYGGGGGGDDDDGDIGVDGGAIESKNARYLDKSHDNDGVSMSMGSEFLDVNRNDVGQDPCEVAENVETSSCTSNFPISAQTFIEAIKKNRSCQKFIRNKMLHIESRMEEIKELQKRLKTLRDFQVQCKKKIGRALSQKQDARVQLVSAPKQRAIAKGSEKNISAMSLGPWENSHVARYKTAMKKFPLLFQREKWSKDEIKALEKGIIIQFQERLFNKSAEVLSVLEEADFGNGVDGMISSITNLDITPEVIQDFSGNVDWSKLASGFPRRSGAECEARWFNYENRLINRSNWTPDEDKRLLLLIQNNGIHNWSYIAEKLETNRTPFQCLIRYQRSLNASILKREWTEDEDAQLRFAVGSFGESNWQAVASALEGRTGTQCSNRWKKTLLPERQRVGRWSINEDKRLRVAVTLFGHKSWHKIAQFVPGRTQTQCRERWVNILDPSLKHGEWTQEEDARLKEAIAEHGYCWSKIAGCVPLRTDNQCRRRWKRLFPNEVPLLRAAREVKKAALISNFVDRESERPALGANDFVTLPITLPSHEQDNEISQPQNSCLRRSGSRKRKVSNGDIPEKKKRKGRKSTSKKKQNSGNLNFESEPKKSCESTEIHENRDTETCSKGTTMRLRPRRCRGVWLKEVPPISHCSVSDITGVHDTCADASSQLDSSEQNNGPEMLLGQSTCDSKLRIHDEEQELSNSDVTIMKRKKRSSTTQSRRGSSSEATVGDKKCEVMHKARSLDAACSRKQNAVKRLKKNKLSYDQSTEWEDLPLSIVFKTAVTRIQRLSRTSLVVDLVSGIEQPFKHCFHRGTDGPVALRLVKS